MLIISGVKECCGFRCTRLLIIKLAGLVYLGSTLLHWGGFLRAQLPKANSDSWSSISIPGHFVEIAARSGIHFLDQSPHTARKYLIETMGSGVALFDCDNDGRLDTFFVNGAPITDPEPKEAIPQKTGALYWNRLYHQKRDGTFEDITEQSGLQGVGFDMGVAVGDYD